MTEIFIYSGDGTEPRQESCLASDISLQQAVDRLKLHKNQYVTDLAQPPFINRDSGEWAEEKDRYVLVKVLDADVADSEFQAGYYLLPMNAADAREAVKALNGMEAG